jgi:hypothetical protein
MEDNTQEERIENAYTGSIVNNDYNLETSTPYTIVWTALAIDYVDAASLLDIRASQILKGLFTTLLARTLCREGSLHLGDHSRLLDSR